MLWRRTVRISPDLVYEPGDLVDVEAIGGSAAARRFFMRGQISLFAPR